MYQPAFGKTNQIRFNSEDEYYELLGYLSKDDSTTRIVWEDNDQQGAWAKEGRIQFYATQPATLRAQLSHTEGTGNILSRVNCNPFVENIIQHHGFEVNAPQNAAAIRATIPAEFLPAFDTGYNM